MQNVTYYEWPQSQECLECTYAEHIPNGDSGCICYLNYDKSQDESCRRKEPKEQWEEPNENRF